MDTSDPTITFNAEGVCNHCLKFDERSKVELKHDNQGNLALNAVIEKIRLAGKGKEYDCIIGVSGGVDSTMVAYQIKKWGLRPLAVHFDNGWNSELAVANIEKAMKKLNIDLYTYVVDWEEFKDFQLSFLKAGVPNIEAPTDHAINAILYRMAAKYNIKFLISGGNLETESVMPAEWVYDNRDWKQIKGIHKKFGQVKQNTYPFYSLWNLFYYIFIKRIKFVKILNYAPFNKKEAMKLLQRELDWTPYAGKHYESTFTKFFQAYILPTKFGYDKRRAHLSSLVLAGQMTREDALEEMHKELYPPLELKQDKEFVLKKFNLSEAEFERIMSEKPKDHRHYPSHRILFENVNKGILSKVRKFALG